jgi:hypothetical protein
MHIAEKYASLARDSMASGDSVAAENYLQHAEHYNRIILAAQAQNPGIPGMEAQNGMNGNGRFHQPEGMRDYDGGSDEGDGDGDGDDYAPLPQQRNYHERPVYNQNQPQPYIPQNALPHAQPQPQPAVPSANGQLPVAGEPHGSPQEAAVPPRRRRRRPVGEPQAKGYNGRQGAPHNGVNGAAIGNDTTPDEAAS